MPPTRREWPPEVRHDCIAFVVAGDRRMFPRAWWQALEGHELIPPGWSCDGCSRSPDWWRGYALWPACLIHDAHYEPGAPLGSNAAGRLRADRALRQNLATLLRLQGANEITAQAVSAFYWTHVRAYGTGAYFYHRAPAGALARLRDVLGRD